MPSHRDAINPTKRFFHILINLAVRKMFLQFGVFTQFHPLTPYLKSDPLWTALSSFFASYAFMLTQCLQLTLLLSLFNQFIAIFSLVSQLLSLHIFLKLKYPVAHRYFSLSPHNKKRDWYPLVLEAGRKAKTAAIEGMSQCRSVKLNNPCSNPTEVTDLLSSPGQVNFTQAQFPFRKRWHLQWHFKGVLWDEWKMKTIPHAQHAIRSDN